MLTFRRLAVVVATAAVLSFSHAHAAEPFALKWSDTDPHGISVQIDTTLPDNAEVRVSLSRAYDATSAGKRDTYSQDYFQEEGSVSDWRDPRRISVNDDTWVAELKADQDRMAKISADMAFEVDSVDPHIEITAYVYAHKSGERYGAREYDSLIDKVRDTELVGKSEIRIVRPMANVATVQGRSTKVAGNALEVHEAYRLVGERVPLMPSHSGGTLDDIADMKILPAGTIILVIEVVQQRSHPWYHVVVPTSWQQGWINSIALLREGVERLPEAPPLLDQQATNSQGHLPAPCAALDNPPPKWFHCPTPYVELVRTGEYDRLYARAWHCRETGHSLATFPDHEGCTGGRHMLIGWELPTEPITVAQ